MLSPLTAEAGLPGPQSNASTAFSVGVRRVDGRWAIITARNSPIVRPRAAAYLMIMRMVLKEVPKALDHHGDGARPTGVRGGRRAAGVLGGQLEYAVRGGSARRAAGAPAAPPPRRAPSSCRPPRSRSGP